MGKKAREEIDILIVDDNPFNLKIAEKILENRFSLIAAKSGREALSLLEDYTPQLILLDLYMPEMSGADTLKRIRKHKEWENIPVLFLTEEADPDTEKECIALGAGDYIVKPFVPSVMQNRVSRAIELYSLRRNMQKKLEEKSIQMQKISLNAIMAIAHTIDAKDSYTAGHSTRVARCSGEIARRLGWNEEEVKNIEYVALLHDIGKIGVPDSILNKPSRLSDEEFEIIKTHPVIGGNILKDVHMLKNVEEGALYHHERYDGKGYPFGLKGEEIPFCARIIGIADAYDAMTSNRIYRYKLSDEQVLAEFERCTGTQFDPQLGSLFVEALKEGFRIPQSDSLGIAGLEELDVDEESGTQLNKALVEYATSTQGKGSVDPLTGLASRTVGESSITTLISSGHRGVLILIDLDNFKMINQSFGHLVGDRILKLLAEMLRVNSRKRDVICRLGGDEFVMFLTDVKDRRTAEARIEKLIRSFAEKLEEADCQNITSISVGAALSPEDGRSFESLYACADKALYHVKVTGKNSYAFYSSGEFRDIRKRPDMDLDHIRCLIEGGMDKSSGVFKVEYDEFKNLYNYISRCVKRKGQMVQTLLFTLSGTDKVDNAVLEEAMAALEVAVAYSLRMVDVGSRYSSVQYIVILVDASLENGKMVADRVIRQFYKIFSGSSVTLSYDIRTMVMGNLEVENLGS